MRAGDEGSIWRVLAQSARDLSGAAFAAVIVRPVPEEHKEGDVLGHRSTTGNAPSQVKFGYHHRLFSQLLKAETKILTHL